MKQGWTYKTLGEVAAFVKDGDWIESKDQSESGIRLIQTGNIGNGVFKLKDDKPHFITVETMARLGCTEIFEGDCLVSRLPNPVGRACQIPNIGCRMITAVDCSIIRFGIDYLPQFFVYYTQSSKYLNRINDKTTGTTRKRISRKNLEKITIPIPPLFEQERIVERLDAAFAQIDELKNNAERQLAEALALFQSALTQAMQPKPGWKRCKFNDLIENLRTGLNPRTHFKLNTSDSLGYYITVRELKGFTFEVDKRTDRINDYAIKRINERSNLKIGDVLYSGTGTIGKTALVQELPTWWNIKEGVYAITPKANVLDSSFLIYVMHSEYFMSEVLSKTSGTTVRSIPMKQLKEIFFSIPSIAEQQIIVEHLDALSNRVRELEEINSETAAECDALKQALLRQIFE